jgi:hypothetical protein
MDAISDVTFDERLTSLYTKATQVLKSRLGYSWERASVTHEMHDPYNAHGKPERRMYLNVLPIQSTPTPVVTVDSVSLTVNVDFWVYKNYIYMPYISSTVPLTVDVSYTGGLVEADLEFSEYSQMLYEIMKYWMEFNDPAAPGALIDYRIPREINQQIIDKKVYDL